MNEINEDESGKIDLSSNLIMQDMSSLDHDAIMPRNDNSNI